MLVKKVLLEAVMVCVDYSDFLDITLSYNLRHFDNVAIVTVERDKETIAVCEKYGIKPVFTNRLYENGDKFNKGKAINDGLKSLTRDNWVLITDADMVMSRDLSDVVRIKKLDDQCVYGTSRHICPDFESWEKYQINGDEKERWKNQNRRLNVGVGFFQLANGKCEKLVGKHDWYSEDFGHCGRSDRMFWRSWPDKQRGKIRELACIHLGDDELAANWHGRTTDKFN